MTDYLPDELMAVLLAREVHAHERVGVGVQSPIGTAGLLLAKYLTAPTARITLRGFPGVQPLIGSKEFTCLAASGKVDLFFLSAAQIDAGANINLQYLGDVQHPTRRFYGAFAAPVYYYVVKRTVLFRAEHSPRVFVRRVDFVTAAGGDGVAPHRLGGPTVVVTPKALLAFNRSSGCLELASFHPGETVETVRAATGFDLPVAADAQQTSPPSSAELQALRGPVYEYMAAHGFPEYVGGARQAISATASTGNDSPSDRSQSRRH